MSEPEILFEGPCCYAVLKPTGFEIVVHAGARHVTAAYGLDVLQAERLCRRLNAYPRQTLEFHGLGGAIAA